MANPIGVIGLGNMGGGMAASLARSGFTVLGRDAVQSARNRAAAARVRVVADIASFSGDVDAILTMLPDSPDVEACLLGPGGVDRQGLQLHRRPRGPAPRECRRRNPDVHGRRGARGFYPHQTLSRRHGHGYPSLRSCGGPV